MLILSIRCRYGSIFVSYILREIVRVILYYVISCRNDDTAFGNKESERQQITQVTHESDELFLIPHLTEENEDGERQESVMPLLMRMFESLSLVQEMNPYDSEEEEGGEGIGTNTNTNTNNDDAVCFFIII